jgi:DNA-binding NarL/FixJ family response regulator
VTQKTVLLVDDEQGFLEALADALEFEGHRVIKAATAEDALRVFERERVDLATVDVMLEPGKGLEGKTSSSEAGIYLLEILSKKYPKTDLFCLSVIGDINQIRKIESLKVRFLRKGETPLRTILNMVRSCLTGIAYSTERNLRRD